MKQKIEEKALVASSLPEPVRLDPALLPSVVLWGLLWAAFLINEFYLRLNGCYVCDQAGLAAEGLCHPLLPALGLGIGTVFFMVKIYRSHQKNLYNHQTYIQKYNALAMGFQKGLLYMVVDPNWEVIEINSSFLQWLQFESQDCIGKKACFFIEGLSEKCTLDALEKGLDRGHTWRGDVHITSPNPDTPQEKWGIFTIVPMGQGKTRSRVIIGFDITDKRILENKLKVLSCYDELTELSNRRSFEQVIEREWLRMKRQHNPLSIIMLDVDFFKKYNDFYGHMKGDECLKKVAKALHETLKRPGDWIARLGGEEFAAILPNTDAHGALEVAEKLRWAIAHLKIPHAKSETEAYVTVSAGVSTTIPSDHNSIAALLETADEALYWAKSQGRNTSRLKPLSENGESSDPH